MPSRRLIRKTVGIEITVNYDEQHRKATVAVADDGAGVPSSYKRKVLNHIFRQRIRDRPGFGIVSSIISDHHGQVSVADNNPTGTIVSFQLPVSEV